MRMRMDGAARLPAAPLINHEEGGQVRLLASSLLLLEAQQSAAPPPPPSPSARGCILRGVGGGDAKAGERRARNRGCSGRQEVGAAEKEARGWHADPHPLGSPRTKPVAPTRMLEPARRSSSSLPPALLLRPHTRPQLSPLPAPLRVPKKGRGHNAPCWCHRWGGKPRPRAPAEHPMSQVAARAARRSPGSARCHPKKGDTSVPNGPRSTQGMGLPVSLGVWDPPGLRLCSWPPWDLLSSRL